MGSVYCFKCKRMSASFETHDAYRARACTKNCFGSYAVEVGAADEVAAAASELRAAGYALLHDARTEPWGQTVAQLQSVDGLIIGVSYAPSLH